MFSDQFGSAYLQDCGAKFFDFGRTDAVNFEKLARIGGAREGYCRQGAVVHHAVGWHPQAFGLTGTPLFESRLERFSIGGQCLRKFFFPARTLSLRRIVVRAIGCRIRMVAGGFPNTLADFRSGKFIRDAVVE